MNIDTVIAAALKNAPALANVRSYPEIAPPKAVEPYVVYTQVAGRRIGDLGGDAGLANPRYQFDVYSKVKLVGSDLKTPIRSALLAEPLLNAVFISDGSGYEPDTKLYRHRQDFSLWFTDK